ncbi:MaoClike domain containing protein [Acanthamoeba castellanii str. Neff]|uniref:MaoClike domain containing protein n=1 Tax=Acanthamoeba castellanii (strain ATCC 30010 / Neff) TaxID=1257118 RepID=L8H4C0_ACACF|nr:MaoClike domain containing protein [Acanthamoeba castellanii str. Neff]ELR19311.1 MaoClike domain containing protein [Acanthamoeba castellanii str. Neff]
MRRTTQQALRGRACARVQPLTTSSSSARRASTLGRFSPTEPLAVGDWSETHKVFGTPEVAQFAALSEDINPIHLDAAYAEKTRFGARIVHGMLSASLFSGILGSQIPGAIYVSQSLSFKAPIYVGEKVTAKVEVTAIHPSKPFVTFTTKCLNTKGGVCIDGEAVVYIPHQHKNKNKDKSDGDKREE